LTTVFVVSQQYEDAVTPSYVLADALSIEQTKIEIIDGPKIKFRIVSGSMIEFYCIHSELPFSSSCGRRRKGINPETTSSDEKQPACHLRRSPLSSFSFQS
jgi:hypothetical protein